MALAHRFVSVSPETCSRACPIGDELQLSALTRSASINASRASRCLDLRNVAVNVRVVSREIIAGNRWTR